VTRAAGLLGLVLVAGCAPETRIEFDVGAHHVSAAVPPGWEHLDQGKRHQFRRGDQRIVLEDMGPTGREGIAREVARARALWRSGRPGEGRQVMTMIPVPDEGFATAEVRRGFWETWSAAANADDRTDAATMEARFDRLMQASADMPERTPEQSIDDALKSVGEDGRRPIASRAIQDVNGRSWVMIDTWSRLGHEDRRPFAFLLNGGFVLMMRVDTASPAVARESFELVLRGLRVRVPA
jgi:hypothetical protein